MSGTSAMFKSSSTVSQLIKTCDYLCKHRKKKTILKFTSLPASRYPSSIFHIFIRTMKTICIVLPEIFSKKLILNGFHGFMLNEIFPRKSDLPVCGHNGPLTSCQVLERSYHRFLRKTPNRHNVRTDLLCRWVQKSVQERA